MHGDDVDFVLLDPKSNVIYEKRDSDGYELEQKIHIGGDYGFCFSNNARVPTGVHFEWDFHLGSPEVSNTVDLLNLSLIELSPVGPWSNGH